MKNFIDSDDEYYLVLFELGLIDDDDNLELFCKLPDPLDDIDFEVYKKYMRQNGREYL
jgi:predicted neutral ceramidase superfamily lipid hydrolase